MSESSSGAKSLPSLIEDALWALNSYESNRDDGGRAWSEVEISNMVAAVRAFAVPPVAAQEYAARNPLGGPAKVFDAIASRLRAGEEYHAVLADYGLAVVSSTATPSAFIEHHKGGDNLIWERSNLRCTPLYLSAPSAIKSPNRLLSELRAKIKASEDAEELEYDGEEGPNALARFNADIDIDDFIAMNGAELLEALEPFAVTERKPK